MTYLKIQQIRFSNRLSVEIGPTPSEFGFLMVPRLILQPILENAFEHGMKNVLEPKLFIRFEARLGEWNVCIEDNGTEFSPEEDVYKRQAQRSPLAITKLYEHQ